MSPATHRTPNTPPAHPLQRACAAGALLAALALLPAAAVAQDADPVQSLVQRAREARDAERYDEAILLLDQAYALHPDPALRFNLAKVYERSGQCQNALRAYAQAAREGAAGALPRTEVTLAARQELRAFTCPTQPDDTLPLLEAALRDDPAPDPALRLNLASHYLQAQRCDLARTHLTLVRDTTPQDHPAHKEAAQTLDTFACVDANADLHPLPDPDPTRAEASDAPSRLAASHLGHGLVGWTTHGGNQLNQQRTRDDLDALFAKAQTLPADSTSYAVTRDAYDKLQRTYDDGQTLSLVGLLVGTLGTAAGLTLWVLDLTEDDPPAATLLPWTPSPDAAGATLHLRLP